MVTSFSSKSELALNLSTDRNFLTFMGYVSPIEAIDVSNSNTPGVIDPTNPVPKNFFRAVAQVDPSGRFTSRRPTLIAATTAVRRSSMTPRTPITRQATPATAAILSRSASFWERARSSLRPRISRYADPGSRPARQLSISPNCANKKPDKIGKDTNFRGLTIFNNVLYYTKGSGGNGINTVYFVDTTGSACPMAWVFPRLAPPSGVAVGL